MCLISPFKFRWSRGYYDIFITHPIIIIKLKVSTFPIVAIFFVVVCLRWLCHYVLSVSYISRENLVLLLLLLCSFMVYTNNRIRYGLMFARYITSLSSLCRRIWRYWTSKILRYIPPCVCLRLCEFSQKAFMQHMGLCVFSLPIPLMMIVRICVLYLIIIIK